MRTFVLCLLAFSLACAQGDARSRKRKKTDAGAAAVAGQFDYYLMSLSWSPDFCASHNDNIQCSGQKKFAFVVHGLWPQFERGYPEDCAGPSFDERQVPPALLEIMPSRQLMAHEWQKHGTCSGLAQEQYFQLVERAFQSIRIPDAYRQPLQNIEVAPQQIKDNFVRANPSAPARAFTLQCAGNRFLSEVRVCLDKNLHTRACSPDVRDACRADTVIMRPVR